MSWRIWSAVAVLATCTGLVVAGWALDHCGAISAGYAGTVIGCKP